MKETITIMNIEQAARAEFAAEQNRARAETVWRQAWWATTMALAAPPHADKKAIGRTFTAAELVLGQTRAWLSKRRAVGQLFIAFEREEISTLPPRLAISYLEANGDPARAIAVLKSAEARELSLRDFAAEMGRQPQSWLRENERPTLPEQIRGLSTEQRAELARALFSDPDTVNAALNRPDIHAPGSGTLRIYSNISRARAEAERQRAADKQFRQGGGETDALTSLAVAISRYAGEGRRLVSDVAALLPQVRPDEAVNLAGAVADAHESHDQAGSTLTALSARSLDNELAKILGSAS